MDSTMQRIYEHIYGRYIEAMTKANAISNTGAVGSLEEYSRRDTAHGLWLSLTIIELYLGIGCNAPQKGGRS